MTKRKIAYTKYIILENVLQSTYIFSRRPNISPVTQSGDMSHPANIIIGDTIAVITASAALNHLMTVLKLLSDSGFGFVVPVHVFPAACNSVAHAENSRKFPFPEIIPASIFTETNPKNTNISRQTLNIFLKIHIVEKFITPIKS